MLRRRQARSSLEAWCREALRPQGLAPARHHLLLIRELERLYRTPGGRLMVFMPPGSAKSTYTSKLFPAWAFAQEPALSLIGASNTAHLAGAFSTDVQSYLRSFAPLLGVQAATRSAARWRTAAGGQYLAAGVGGTITGFRADLAVIDDPVRSREEADSATIREKIWSWWLSDLRTRLRPGGRVALVMTRWHEDDLAGRLLAHQGGRWRVVRLPAMAEEGDPLGRASGEPLWGDDGYGYAAELDRLRDEYEASGDGRAWWALYQQDPRAPEGLLFQIAKIATLEAAPAGGRIVRAWDLAATVAAGGGDPDWTAGVKLARGEDGRYTVLDLVRLRGGPEAVEAAIRNTAAQDGAQIAIGLAQDPGQAGKAQAAYLASRLAGYTLKISPETGEKATRAAPLASQVNVGNLSLLRAGWNRALLEEMRDFPAGRHDDQIDALSRAFAMLTTGATARQRKMGY